MPKIWIKTLAPYTYFIQVLQLLFVQILFEIVKRCMDLESHIFYGINDFALGNIHDL